MMKHREIDYLKIVRILFSRWYLLLGTMLIAVIIACIYLWYSPKTYTTSGMLKFEEKKPELSDLVKVMSNVTRSPASLQSEKSIIHSRGILLEAIKRLDYKVSVYSQFRGRAQELYPQQPLRINLLKQAPQTGPENLISFKSVNHKTFRLSWNVEGKEMERNFLYNQPIDIQNTIFTISYSNSMSKDSTYYFKFNQPESLLERVSKGLYSSETFKSSTVITLRQTDSNPYFAANVLNAVMSAYLDYDHSQKAQSATKMIQFINGQLDYLSSKVSDAETELEKQKQSSGIMDIRISVNQTASKLGDLESQHALLKSQELAIRQLKKQITENKKEVSLNFNLEGHIDPLLGTLISNLNQLLQEKLILLKTYHNNASPVQEIQEQIEQVKNAALRNIHATQERLLKNKDQLNSRQYQLNRQATALPSAEKKLLSLGRNFEINEKVYSFLSEKKLETQINRAAILPGATIIEPAQVNPIPVTPSPAKVYRTAVILGLLSGLMILVLLRILSPYIYSREVVLSATTIPIAGMIRKFPGKTDTDNIHTLDLIKHRSVFTESVRAVRTYLNFLAKEKASKVICITSEIAGEGKSFVALSLSTTLAMINKKVIIIGADLRRPKLHKAFGSANTEGLSAYLQGQNSINEIIRQTTCKNLDFINSGEIPGNPAELLHSKAMATLISELRERYEMILIDTAPIGMVSDAIPLFCNSDINLFIIRYGKSRHSALPIPQGLATKYKLSNMAIVLNAFEENHLQSGYYKDDANQDAMHYCTDYSNYKNSDYYA